MHPSAEIPQGSVVITPTEMYREIQDVGKKVDHLTDVLDPAITSVREDIVEIKAEQVVQRQHLGALDRRVTAMTAVATVVGAAAGWLLPMITR